jgi:beta-lactam-binding protein with PASTA domain
LNVGAVAKIALPDPPADRVIAQSPSASASSISAPKISLLTAQPAPPQAFLMPSFVGQTLGQATAALKDAGFQPGTATIATPQAGSSPQPPPPAPQPSPSSVILSQNPAPGSKVLAGSNVTFEVR